MTSKEIDETVAVDKSERSWLKEIAYQLALLNEKRNNQPLPKGHK
jgi:hypothetical protein